MRQRAIHQLQPLLSYAILEEVVLKLPVDDQRLKTQTGCERLSERRQHCLLELLVHLARLAVQGHHP